MACGHRSLPVASPCLHAQRVGPELRSGSSRYEGGCGVVWGLGALGQTCPCCKSCTEAGSDEDKVLMLSLSQCFFYLTCFL